MLRIITLALMASLVVGFKDYSGYKVIRFQPETEKELLFVNSLESTLGEVLDFWQKPRGLGRSIDIMLSPTQLKKVDGLLQNAGIKPSVMIENLQANIDAQMARPEVSAAAGFQYDIYHTSAEIDQWISDFAAANPSLVSIFNVGVTFEGRPIDGLKFSTGGTGKPVAFFFGGIHAREWVSPATMLNFGRKFVEDYGTNAELTALLDNMDFYMIPSLNKDGYEYTWLSDRMWRKTRSINAGNRCDGVDPNRNWDSNFGGVGSSAISCIDTYHGPTAFSESETKGVSDFILNLQTTNEVRLFIDFHAYSQLWMFSYGYTYDKCADHDELMAVGTKAINRLQAVHGTVYETGNIAQIIYEASGGSSDWAYDAAGIKFSYALELRDTGDFGFTLPANQILATGDETYEGFLSVATDVCGTDCQ